MRFSGFQGTSLVDYPDRVSSVLFTPGCNMRCPFCHNWRIVVEPRGPYLSEDEALHILRKRRMFVDAVVISGGEPTIHEGLPRFLKKLSEDGFSVKLDTNGLRPDILKECLGYVDYVAMDIKTSFDRYGELGAGPTDTLLESTELLKKGLVDYEFRCTAVPNFVNKETVIAMGRVVSGAKRFAFQQFIPDDTLVSSFTRVSPYNVTMIRELGELIAGFVDEVILRI